MVLAVLTVSLMNCGGDPEKVKVIKFLERSTEMMKTEEYQKQGNFEDMTNKVLAECGYNSFDDFSASLKKYYNDPDVAAKSAEYAKIQGGSEN